MNILRSVALLFGYFVDSSFSVSSPLGGIYAVGGYGDSGRLQSVERYDPSNDIWTPVASMSTKRTRLAVGVVTLNEKQFLYAVGGDGGSTYLQSVERYDPSNDIWTPVASMSTKRYKLAVGVITGFCNAGEYYLESPDRCELCPAGYVCDEGTTNANKVLCPAGYVCDEGTTPATQNNVQCPAGYVCDEGTSSASKLQCPAGYVCSEGSTPATQNNVLCPAGYVCDAGTTPATQNNVPCPARYICPVGTSPNTKSLCEVGFYCDEGTLTELPCPAKYFCPVGTSSDTISLCPAQFYCDKGATSPLSCLPRKICLKGTSSDNMLDASSYDYPPQFIAAVSIFGAVLLLSAIIVLYSKQRKHNEHAKYGAMLSFPFGLLDFMLDGVFLSSTLMDSGPDPKVKLIGYISLGFVVVPLFVNLLCMVRIIRREIKENEAFSVWFSKNSVPFILLIVVCSTNSGAILITCCGVGGYSVLSAPWSPHALLKLNAIGLVTNLGEDLPQTVIQLLYIFFTNTSGNIPDFIIVSITTSLLMIVNNVVRRCLGLTNDKEQLRRAETLNRSVPMLQAKYASEEEEDEQLRIQLQQIEARRAKLKEKLKKKSQVF